MMDWTRKTIRILTQCMVKIRINGSKTNNHIRQRIICIRNQFNLTIILDSKITTRDLHIISIRIEIVSRTKEDPSKDNNISIRDYQLNKIILVTSNSSDNNNLTNLKIINTKNTNKLQDLILQIMIQTTIIILIDKIHINSLNNPRE